MITIKQNLLKRSMSLLLALVMCIGMIVTTAFVAETTQTTSKTYFVPIKSLTSACSTDCVCRSIRQFRNRNSKCRWL